MTSKQESILITGGAGYIGSHVAALATSKGFRVVVVDDLSTGEESNLPEGAIFVKGSILDDKTMNKAFGYLGQKDEVGSQIKSIVHLAGKKAPSESEIDPFLYWSTNVIGTIKTAAAAAKFNCSSALFSSSCSVYGNVDGVIDEERPLKPISVYGKTKSVGEEIFSVLDRQYGIPTGILRYFNVVGTGLPRVQDKSNTNLFPLLISSLESDREIRVFGVKLPTKDGSCERDYIHVVDIASAHMLAMERLLSAKSSFTLNLGTGKVYSVLEVIQSFERISGKQIKYKPSEPRPGDPVSVRADPSNALREIRWLPMYDFEEMVSSSLFPEKIESFCGL